MADLLVRLFDLPEYDRARLAAHGVTIRRALPPEKTQVLDWVGVHFNERWVSECDVAFSRVPLMAWIAVREGEMVGFACGDVTARGFFGPTGVAESERGKGIGEALLFETLIGLREAGFAYAVIGDPGPVAFYQKRLDAMEIPGSTPGVYRGMLKSRDASE